MKAKPVESGVTEPSALLLYGFNHVARRRFRNHFRALRIANPERLQAPASGPLIIYLNHPSWWDPITCLMLARARLPHLRHHAPMDLRAMRQFPFFRHIGLFPLDLSTTRGAAQFLRATAAILSTPGKALWVTAEGHFTDVRKRPIELKPGLGALLHRIPLATVIPLAIEYTFWNERQPEALAHCGEPIIVTNGPSMSTSEWTIQLELRMQQTQNHLAALALTRDASNFTTIMDNGRSGAGGVYSFWQRFRGNEKPL